jgi:hypothetical protein
MQIFFLLVHYKKKSCCLSKQPLFITVVTSEGAAPYNFFVGLKKTSLILSSRQGSGVRTQINISEERLERSRLYINKS